MKMDDEQLLFICKVIIIISNNIKNNIPNKPIIDPLMLQKLDQTSTKYYQQKSHSTTPGKLLSLACLLLLGTMLVYKLSSMLQKQKMYLNSFYTNDRSSINVSDFGFRLRVRGWDQIPVVWANQSTYGLNFTVVEFVERFDGHQGWRQSEANFIQQVQHAKKMREKKESNLGFQYKIYRMVACQDDPTAFCTPPELLQNMTLQGDSYFQDDPTISYQIQIVPCDQTDPSCKPPSKLGYLSIFSYRCRNFDVYQKNTSAMISQCKIPTGSLNFIADSANIQQRIDYKLKQINISTIEPTFLPAFIPNFLLPLWLQNPKFQQFWYYDNQFTSSMSNRTTGRQPYFIVSFSRSRKSQAYERTFIGIQVVLAEIFGISGFVGLLLRVLLGGYVRWDKDCYVYQEISKKQNNQGNGKAKGGFCTFLKQKLLLFCPCGRKQQDMNQLHKKKQVLEEAYKNMDIISANERIKKMQEQIRMLERVLSEAGLMKKQKQNQSNSCNMVQIESSCDNETIINKLYQRDQQHKEQRCLYIRQSKLNDSIMENLLNRQQVDDIYSNK